MAWKRKFRRRRMGTEWLPSPEFLSLASGEVPVQAVNLSNLRIVTGNTSTVAEVPRALDEFFDDNIGSAATTLEDRAVEKRTFLRLVGMFRPIALSYQEDQNSPIVGAGGEVRYAIYRGDTNDDEADWSQNPATPFEVTGTNQPDLFLSTHLGSERIAWMRSFLLPTYRNILPTGDAARATTVTDALLMQAEFVNQACPWLYDAALTVIDLRSKRRVTTSSKMYLLRQVRYFNGTVDNPPTSNNLKLYHADFARLLASARIG